MRRVRVTNYNFSIPTYHEIQRQNFAQMISRRWFMFEVRGDGLSSLMSTERANSIKFHAHQAGSGYLEMPLRANGNSKIALA